MNPWNTQFRFEINEEYSEKIKSWYIKDRHDGAVADENSIKYLKHLYFEEEYGLKLISREIGISYTQLRRLFLILKIPIRSGKSVVTKKVKEFRKTRILGNKNPWFDWPSNPKRKGMNKSTKRGISGYFKRKDGELVWLRSSWEYIYAKWLDKNNIDWKIEEKKFEVEKGSYYLPDFFIYENGILKHIVEVKGYFKSRLYKAELLEKKFGIKVITITDIRDYTKNYNEELREWKSARLLEKP